MALVDVAFEGISGGTELIAMLTRISIRLEVFRLHMSFCIAGVVEFLTAHGAGEAPAGVRRHHALDRVIQHPWKSHGSRRSRFSGIRLGHVIYFQV